MVAEGHHTPDDQADPNDRSKTPPDGRSKAPADVTKQSQRMLVKKVAGRHHTTEDQAEPNDRSKPPTDVTKPRLSHHGGVVKNTENLCVCL